MNLAGSQTEKNLLKAFAGESQARNRYEFAARIAQKEGYEQIAGLFQETADNEKVHAKTFFKFLEGRELEITASYPAGKIGTTIENLKHAAMGENEEWTKLYPQFADIAQEEGFTKIAAIFRLIAKIEAEHESRFNKLLKNIEEGKVFKKDQKNNWKCRNCGHVHNAETAPQICPTCEHPQAFFEIKNINY